MTREELLKNCILSQYKSVRDFCLQLDVPYSTINSIFKRGIMTSSVSLMIAICDRLNIDLDSLVAGEIKEKAPVLNELTLKERALILAYRNNPAMQSAVDKLLGVQSSAPTIGEDIASTISAALEKTPVKK